MARGAVSTATLVIGGSATAMVPPLPPLNPLRPKQLPILAQSPFVGLLEGAPYNINSACSQGLIPVAKSDKKSQAVRRDATKQSSAAQPDRQHRMPSGDTLGHPFKDRQQPGQGKRQAHRAAEACKTRFPQPSTTCMNCWSPRYGGAGAPKESRRRPQLSTDKARDRLV